MGIGIGIRNGRVYRYRSVIDSAGGPKELMSSSESSESGRGCIYVSLICLSPSLPPGFGNTRSGVSEQVQKVRFTRVDKVVGIIVVADWTGLCLVELRILDFFELDHDGWIVAAVVILKRLVWRGGVRDCRTSRWRLFAKCDLLMLKLG